MADVFTNGHSTIGFAMLQLCGVYHWQTSVTSGDDMWSMPGVH